jgi:hypothetical protein
VRFFGVFQARFPIVRGPARFWDKKTLDNNMTACVILQNRIIADETDLDLEYFYDNVGGSSVEPTRNLDRIQAFIKTYWQIEDNATHTQLRDDLIGHH